MVARLVRDQKVKGSNPFAPTNCASNSARIEYHPPKVEVERSNRSWRAKIKFNIFMNSLGKYLKEIREMHRLNLEDAALFLDLDKSILSAIENDEFMPNKSILLRFQNFYSVSIDEIVKHIDNTNANNTFFDEDKKYRSFYLIFKRIAFVVTLFLSLIAYILLGQFTYRGYEIYWTLLFLPFIASSLVSTFYFHKFSRFPIVFIVLSIYLSLGMSLELWHPYWSLLFIIPLYYLISIALDLHFTNLKLN